MSREYNFYVYIIASFNKVIYIGVTSNLAKRIYEHKNGLVEGFTKKYRCHRLVCSEYYDDIRQAIKREKEIKKWRREKKIILIEKQNPDWKDLYIEYFGNNSV